MVNLFHALGAVALVAAVSATSAAPAQATFISASFRVTGLVYDYSGSPLCTEEERAQTGCMERFDDGSATGRIVMYDFNDDGHIGLFEWVSFEVGWSAGGRFGGGYWGTLPLDFDPGMDPYNPEDESLLAGLSFSYREIFDGDRPTGRLTGEGSIIYQMFDGGAGASIFDGKASFGTSDPFANESLGSPADANSWSAVVFGDRPLAPPPPPVPLPAAAWFFLSALGALFGLRFFGRAKVTKET